LRFSLLVPSVLSVTRLVLTAPAVMAVLDTRWLTALIVSLIAGASDAVDGWVARRWQLATRTGAWLDPVADKVFAAGIYVALGATGVLPVWLVCLVFARDVLILLMAAYALTFTRLRDFPPSVWGKVSTVFQVSTAAATMAAGVWPSALLRSTVDILFIVTAAATLWSGFHYVSSGLSRLRRLRR
jgi:cardiolipin synthase